MPLQIDPFATSFERSPRTHGVASRPLSGFVCVFGAMLAVLLVGIAAFVPDAHAEECPNAVFRTGPSARLPDCRAYELVSPSYEDAGRPALLGYSPEGTSGMMLIEGGALPDLESDTDLPSFLPGGYYTTQRTATGWTTVADDPPATEYQPYLAGGFTDFAGASLNGQTTLWMERQLGQPENSVSFFVRGPDRSIEDVGPALPPTVAPGLTTDVGEQAGLSPVAVSADGSRLLFLLRASFWPGDGTEERGGGSSIASLYEYVGTGNATPLLVGVEDSGKQIGQCGVALGAGGLSGESSNQDNAISLDGNTVFFTAFPDDYKNDGCTRSAPPVAELFARIDSGLPDAHTVAISEPTEEDCALCDTKAGMLAEAKFESASENGEKVFFSTSQPLLDGTGGLYEYDFAAPSGERVKLVGAGSEVISVSSDGSRVYFHSGDALGTAPNSEGQSPQSGADNAYVYDTETGQTSFITDGEVGPSNITPDGRFLVFTSYGDLTPDDTSTAQQVFEYDAQTGELVRVSIGQGGFNHNGNASLERNAQGFPINNATIVLPGYERYSSSAYSSRLSVSANGSYVFFQSPVGLTPQALNQQEVGFAPGANGHSGVPIYANNVYEYHAGQVSLISDGQDINHTTQVESSLVKLLTTDLSGGDVLFTTGDRLVAQDADSNLDIYDARVDGGFPAPVSPSSCSGEACQGALSGAPTLLSSGSELQAGGNPPLATEPVVSGVKSAKSKKPAKKKTKKKGRKVPSKRRSKKAKKAAVGGRTERKVGL